MVEDKIRAYIDGALERHHHVEDIMANLINAGHNSHSVHSLTKERVQQRIRLLENRKSDLAKKYPGIMSTLFSLLLRGLVGVAAVWAFTSVIVNA
jgi:hypothetical protein